MAITKDQLEIKIGVEAGQLVKSLDDITEKMKQLSKDTDRLDSSIKNVSKTDGLYNDAIQNTVKTMQKEQEAIDVINNRLNSFSKQLENANQSIDRGGFTKLENSISSLRLVFIDIIPLATLFVGAIQQMSNPVFAKRMDNILAILQATAEIEGFPKIAASIEKIRMRAESLLEAIRQLNKELADGGMGSYLDNLSAQANFYLSFKKAIDVLSISMVGFAAIYATQFAAVFFKYDLAKGILDGANSIAMATVMLNKNIASYTSEVIDTYTKYANWVSKVGLKNALKWKLQEAVEAIPNFSQAMAKAFANSKKVIGLSLVQWSLGLESAMPELFVRNLADRIVLLTIPSIAKSTKNLAKAITLGFFEVSKSLTNSVEETVGPIVKSMRWFSGTLNYEVEKIASEYYRSGIRATKTIVKSIALTDLAIRDGISNLGKSLLNTKATAFPYASILDNIVYSFDRVSFGLKSYFKTWGKDLLILNPAQEFVYSATKGSVLFDVGTNKIIDNLENSSKSIVAGFSLWRERTAQAAVNSIYFISKSIVATGPLLNNSVKMLAKFVTTYRAEIELLLDVSSLLWSLSIGDPFILLFDTYFTFEKYVEHFSFYSNLYRKAAERHISNFKWFAEALNTYAKKIPGIISKIPQYLDTIQDSGSVKNLRTFLDSFYKILTVPLGLILDIFPQTSLAIYTGFTSISKTIALGFKTITENMSVDGIRSSLAYVSAAFQSGFAAIPGFIKAGLTKISSMMTSIDLFLSNKLIDIIVSLSGSFKKIQSIIPEFIQTVSALMATGFSKASAAILSFSEFLKTSIPATLSRISEAFTATNKSFIDLFSSAITGGISKFKEFTSVGSGIPKLFADIIKASPKSSFLILAEYGQAMSSAFGLLGIEMLKSESYVVKFFGAVTLAASLALGGLSSIIGLLLGQIGSLAYSLGSKLVDATTEFAKAANKADLVASQFRFTIAGFNREFGEESTGGVKKWEESITQAMENSTYSTIELQKAVKVLVAEGSAINLTFDETSKLLTTGMDLAASSGNDLNDTIVTMVKALAGVNSVGLLNVGVNLGDIALSHSKFSEQLGKTTDEMSKNELLQARLFELYRQTAPIIGAAANEVGTLEGKTKALNRSLAALEVKFGQGGIFSQLYASGLLNIATALTKIPGPIITAVSAVTDFLGIFLKLTGIAATFSLSLLGLISLYKVLNLVLAQSALAQTIVNAGFSILNKTIGTNIVAVTSLSGVWLNFQRIMSAGILVILGQLGSYFLAAAKGVAIFTGSLLANPLFIKGAVIITVLYALGHAIAELYGEVNTSNEELKDQKGLLDDLEKLWKKFTTVISSFFTTMVQGFKLLIYGLAAFGLFLSRIKLQLDDFFKKPDDKLTEKLIDIDSKINALGKGIEKSADKIFVSFEKAGISSKAFGDEIKLAADDLKLLELRQGALNKAAASIDAATISIEVLGTEYEKLANTISVTKKELESLSKEYLKGSENSKEVIDKYKKSVETLKRAEAELTKLRIDSLKEVDDITKEANKDRLKLNANETVQIIAQFQERRDALKEYEQTLKNIGPLSTESAAKIISAYEAIAKAEKASISDAKRKREQEGIAETIRVYKEQYQALKDIQDKNIEIEKFNKNEGLTNREKIASDLGVELKLIEQRLEIEKATWGETSKVSEELRKQKRLLEQQAKIRTEKSPSAKYERIAKVGTDIGEGITRSFTNGFSGMLAGSASIVGSMGTAIGAITAAINALLDFIPNLLNSFAEIFNKITDFPETLFKAFQGLFDAMVRFVQEFIPKLVESIFKSFTQIKDFANNIANALDNLANQLPDIISNLIEKLPDIMVSLIENLAKSWLKILAAVYIKLPAAVIKGIISGVSKLWEGIKRLFAGKSFLPKIKVDATDAAKKIGDKLSGASGRLFSVKDLTDAAKDPVQAMTDSIEESFKKGTDWIKQAWMWVYEKVLRPIWDLVTKAWRWVYDNVIGPIVTVVQQAFQWVYDNVIAPILNVVKEAWQWVYDNVIAPIISVVMTAFQYVKDLFDGLAGIVQGAFQFVKDIFDQAVGLGSKIWEGLKDGIQQAGAIFGNIGTQIWESLKSGLSGIGNFLKNIFDKLDPSNLFAKIFKVDMGGDGNPGKVESALGINIPFMKFASGGLVPGQAKIKGDSLQNDRILAMLSPGEAIIPRSKMDDPKVRALVDQILSGELDLPQFGLGGTLGEIVKGGGNAVSGVLQDLGDAGQVVIDQVSGAAQGAGDWLGDVFNNANPLKAMWEVVKDKVFNDMILSMFKNNRFALGGPVPNMGTDTVPAMLTPGEFIMSRPAVQSIGLDNLRAMNNGSSLGGSNTYNMSFEINVEAKTSMDEGYIRGTLIPRMSEELKRASLDGKFVLSQKGIR